MYEYIHCRVCNEYEEVQILSEQYHERLCYLCYCEKEEADTSHEYTE